jgi:hypothetical protein
MEHKSNAMLRVVLIEVVLVKHCVPPLRCNYWTDYVHTSMFKGGIFCLQWVVIWATFVFLCVLKSNNAEARTSMLYKKHLKSKNEFFKISHYNYHSSCKWHHKHKNFSLVSEIQWAKPFKFILNLIKEMTRWKKFLK